MMGWTRARRYANHPGGKKYGRGRTELPREENAEKAESARIFREVYERVLEDPVYVKRLAAHRALFSPKRKRPTEEDRQGRVRRRPG